MKVFVTDWSQLEFNSSNKEIFMKIWLNVKTSMTTARVMMGKPGSHLSARGDPFHLPFASIIQIG